MLPAYETYAGAMWDWCMSQLVSYVKSIEVRSPADYELNVVSNGSTLRIWLRVRVERGVEFAQVRDADRLEVREFMLTPAFYRLMKLFWAFRSGCDVDLPASLFSE